jgi:hypothetical protein
MASPSASLSFASTPGAVSSNLTFFWTSALSAAAVGAAFVTVIVTVAGAESA